MGEIQLNVSATNGSLSDLDHMIQDKLSDWNTVCEPEKKPIIPWIIQSTFI